jgi:O-antigen/teichoic acid export membrane protein
MGKDSGVRNSSEISTRKSVYFVLVSQVLVLGLGILKTLLIPAVVGINDFAYWQIYVFYVAYVGLFTLGFNDGIYLRYGGVDYGRLDNGRMRSSIRVYFIYLLVVTALMSSLCLAEPDRDKRIVLCLASLNIVLMGMMAVFSFVLQATGRLKRFGVISAIDKILFLVFLLALFVASTKFFIWFVFAELVSKVVALGFMCVSCWELIKGPGSSLDEACAEVKENVTCGLKLMFANLSGMLVLGIGRVVIEHWGTLQEYAFYAFGVSMTNLALVALTSISVVIYPVLKRLPEGEFLRYYDDANSKLFKFNLLMLGGYFPVVWLITYQLPKYVLVIPYLGLLFVVSVLQSKMQLLNNNFYKALRFEGAMLRANVESLVIALVLSLVLYALHRTAVSIAFAALLTMLYRVFMSERFLRRAVGGAGYTNIVLEIGAYGIFIAITSVLNVMTAFCAYCFVFGIYVFYAKHEFKELTRFVVKGGRT